MRASCSGARTSGRAREFSNVGEMVNAFNSAVSAGVDGIAVALIDPTCVQRSDAPRRSPPGSRSSPTTPTRRTTTGLAYIGQDLFLSGQEMGEHIASSCPPATSRCSSPRRARSTSSLGSTAPRTRSRAIRRSRRTRSRPEPGSRRSSRRSTPTSPAHPNTKGLFAVDGGSTQYVGAGDPEAQPAAKGVKGGGYDLTPVTEQTLASGALQFTIDQQPYLQGFLPVLRAVPVQGVAEADGPRQTSNTGLKFLDKTTVVPYNSTKSRYEGTGTARRGPEVVDRGEEIAMAVASDSAPPASATAGPSEGLRPAAAAR